MSRIPLIMIALVLGFLVYKAATPVHKTIVTPNWATLPLEYKQADYTDCEISSPGEGVCTNVKTKLTWHFCEFDSTIQCKND